jgi:hypothetical protein
MIAAAGICISVLFNMWFREQLLVLVLYQHVFLQSLWQCFVYCVSVHVRFMCRCLMAHSACTPAAGGVTTRAACTGQQARNQPQINLGAASADSVVIGVHVFV